MKTASRPASRDATADEDPHRTHADIEAMIARVALGDRTAFEALYDATNAKLYAVCLRVLKNTQPAEDAMQDAYVKIWKNADRYRVTGHSPMTWLITIARNTAIDRVRLRRGHDDLGKHDATLAAPGATPEQAAIAASEASRIVLCMAELPDDRRRAVTGAYLDGKTYADLAREADIPVNTMRTWLRRGLIALRECMAR